MATPAPNYVLSQLTKENLVKMAKLEKVDVSMKDTKSKIVSTLSTEVEDAGIRSLTAEMKKVDLEGIVEDLKIDIGKGNASTKTVLRKKMIDAATTRGLTNLIEDLSTNQLKVFIRAASVEPVSANKEELRAQAIGLAHLIGLSAYFSKFDVTFLQEVMEQIGLKFNTDSKAKIVHAIATQTNAKKDKSNRDEPTFSKTKKTIKKGITYQDIFQHYLLEELVDYCRDNDLKVSGTKPELINRILAFLDGDTENTKAANPSVKKAETPQKKEKPAKEKPAKAAKEAKSKKEETKPEEEGSEEEEGSDE